jgi:hypothetical protein
VEWQQVTCGRQQGDWADDAQIWTNGRVTLGNFGQMRWCHVAQAWAATWHPVSSRGKFQKFWGPWVLNP